MFDYRDYKIILCCGATDMRKSVVLKENFEVNTRKELLAEIEALKSQLKQKDEKIQSLEKLNDWYIEQLKLKLKEKFGVSSEKADPNQLSLFDLFNEAETLMQPITTELELETVIKAHTRKKYCDGYNGYKQLEGVTLCGCLVHAKKKFHDAVAASPYNELAKTGEEYIRKLFAIEDKADKDSLSIEERYSIRQKESRKIFDEFYGWIASVEHKILPQSLVGKAIKYAINQKEYLASFMLDGRIQLSNNIAEQSVKPFVIGRKNWLFSNTINGAKASTTIYSIIQTAIANELKPEKYLEFLFTGIQQGKDVAKLVPWSDEIPEYCRLKKAQQK